MNAQGVDERIVNVHYNFIYFFIFLFATIFLVFVPSLVFCVMFFYSLHDYDLYTSVRTFILVGFCVCKTESAHV